MNQKQLAKAFADGARTGRSGNVFIDGDRIYSYGYHFVIAERVTKRRFKVTTVKYSQSTARQKYKITSVLVAEGKTLTLTELPFRTHRD